MAEMVNPLYIFYHSKIFLKDEKKKVQAAHHLSDMTNLFRKFKFQFGKVYPGAESGIIISFRGSYIFLELTGHGVVLESKKTKL